MAYSYNPCVDFAVTYFHQTRLAHITLQVQELELGQGWGTTITAASESAAATALQSFMYYTAAGIV
jgi:dsRNA-specific ribonuclease